MARNSYMDSIDGSDNCGGLSENQQLLFNEQLRAFIKEMEDKTGKSLFPFFNFQLHPILLLLTLNIVSWRALSDLDFAEAIKIWSNLDKQLADFDNVLQNTF
jgi:hypothetical protein